MKMYKLAALGVLPLFLLGCPAPEEEPFVDEQPAEERAHQVGDTETVGLSEIEDSGVTGDARFTVLTMNETDVIVEVEDATPNATYRAAIHRGSCDNVGAQAHQLDEIQTNDQGNGATNTTLNVQLANVMDGNHVVAVYGPRADDGTNDQDPETAQATDLPVACGDISEHGTGLGW